MSTRFGFKVNLNLKDYDATGSPVASVKLSSRKEMREKQFELSLKLDEKMSPELKILLFTIVDGEIVADSLSIELAKCLSHKVTKQKLKPDS